MTDGRDNEGTVRPSAEGAPAGGPALLSLYLTMMAMGAGQTVVFAVLPMLGRELSLHELVLRVPIVGLVFEPRELAITALSAMTAFVFALTAPRWGRRSDTVGRKRIIILGVVGYAIGTLAFNSVAWLGLHGLLAGGLLYVLLVLSRLFHASIMSAAHPAASAYMVDVTTVAQRTRGMVKLQTFNQLGVMLGPALAWFVQFSYLTPLFIQAGISLIVALMVWRYLPESPALPVHSPGESATERRSPAKLSYFDPRFRRLLFIGFATFSLVSMVQQTLGFYFQDRLGLDGVRAAQYFSASMVVSSLSMIIAQVLVLRYFNKAPIRLAAMGIPFLICAFVLMSLSGALPLLLLAMSSFGVGMGMVMPGINASASLVVDAQEQGALAGMIGSAIGMGFVTGPLFGGYLYSLHFTAPFMTASVAAVGILLLLSRTAASIDGKRADDAHTP